MIGNSSIVFLKESEINSILESCKRAVTTLLNPMTSEEAKDYKISPSSALELYKYTDFIVRRIIKSLKAIQEFRALTVNQQMNILKVFY